VGGADQTDVRDVWDPVRSPAGPSAAVHHANQIPSRGTDLAE
jgi:hypothetical protein